MIVERNILAILLETRPNRIANIEQTENKIHIQLRGSQERLTMTVEEYEACYQQLKSSNQMNAQNLVTVAIIFGLFITATISSMNTDLIGKSNSPDNIELTADR